VKPVHIENADLGPAVRALGYYSAQSRHPIAPQLKVGLPARLVDAVGWAAHDHVRISLWEREDGRRVLVLEPDEGPTRDR
jgi:hypothetical protein